MTSLRVFVALVPHRARAALRSPLAGYASLVAAPAVVTIARGGRDLTFSASVAVLASGSACAFALDDRSRDALSACPKGWTQRHLAGLPAVVAAISIAWMLIGGLGLAYDAPVGSMVALADETAAAAALAIGFAAGGRRWSARVGLAAAVGALLTMAVVSGLSLQTPLDWLPVVGMPAHTRRWLLVATAAGAAALWWLRDPAGRRSLTTLVAAR